MKRGELYIVSSCCLLLGGRHAFVLQVNAKLFLIFRSNARFNQLIKVVDIHGVVICNAGEAETT